MKGAFRVFIIIAIIPGQRTGWACNFYKRPRCGSEIMAAGSFAGWLNVMFGKRAQAGGIDHIFYSSGDDPDLESVLNDFAARHNIRYSSVARAKLPADSEVISAAQALNFTPITECEAVAAVLLDYGIRLLREFPVVEAGLQ